MSKRNILIGSILPLTILVTVLTVVPVVSAATCAGVETSVISCSEEGESAIFFLLKRTIQIMTVGVFVVAVGATIAGALFYSAAGGSPDKVKKARDIWVNTVIGLLLYAFVVAITNFLIPGGVF